MSSNKSYKRTPKVHNTHGAFLDGLHSTNALSDEMNFLLPKIWYGPYCHLQLARKNNPAVASGAAVPTKLFAHVTGLREKRERMKVIESSLESIDFSLSKSFYLNYA